MLGGMYKPQVNLRWRREVKDAALHAARMADTSLTRLSEHAMEEYLIRYFGWEPTPRTPLAVLRSQPAPLRPGTADTENRDPAGSE